MAPQGQAGVGDKILTCGKDCSFPSTLEGMTEEQLREILRVYLKKKVEEFVQRENIAGKGYRKFGERTGIKHSQLSKIIEKQDRQYVSYRVLCRVAATVGP